MDRAYDHGHAEPGIVRKWLESGLFSAPAEGPEATYSTPNSPPNVTGVLHMGHALNASLRDTLIRYNRLRGKRATWVFGTDHAGIATHTRVEDLVRREGGDRLQMGRDAFEDRVWEWCDTYGGRITTQFQRLGASADFSQPHFTLDDDYSRAVLKTFVHLYEKGCIYRGNYMVNWDPGSASAISNFEVENREVTDELFTVAFPLVGGGEIEVATTRPETMPGDTAIAVHPEDGRYVGLIGRRAIAPVGDRELPIVADRAVDPELGTGAVKISPAHSFVDFEIGERCGLEVVGVIGEDGLMSAAAGELAGMSVEEAKQEVIALLRARGLLRGQELFSHNVPHSHRSGARIEPLISLQWFLRLDPLAGPAIEAIESGRVSIRPEPWQRICLEWMRNPTPWCISRQLWWGHRLPVWYRGEETHVGEEPPVGEGWVRDPDVLDTWYSATPWPFGILGWPGRTPEMSAFYPTDVMLTARDIVLMWFPQMIMFGLEFAGDVPFRNVYVHSIIQAPDGRRMSKSLGTGIDPMEEIERYGGDAVRFGLLTMSTTQDVRYSTGKIRQGERFANKLWSAARLILASVGDGTVAAPRPRTLADRWILSRLAATRIGFDRNIEEFEFAEAADRLYKFVRDELCGSYLEFTKDRFVDGSAEPELSGTMLHVLAETLLLVHPIMPFVSEEIWSNLPGERELCVGSEVGPVGAVDAEAEREMERITVVIKTIRSWREVAKVPKHRTVRVVAEPGFEAETRQLVARGAKVEFANSRDGDAEWAEVAIAAGVLHLELERVQRSGDRKSIVLRRTRLEDQIRRRASRLADNQFLSQAPRHAVEAEQQRLRRQEEELSTLPAS